MHLLERVTTHGRSRLLSSRDGAAGDMAMSAFGRPDADVAMQGYALILMDEIDAHMHPLWQQQLLGRLKKLLPNVQVIATTHSPLVVAGLEVEEVTRFVRNEAGEVVAAPIDNTIGTTGATCFAAIHGWRSPRDDDVAADADSPGAAKSVVLSS